MTLAGIRAELRRHSDPSGAAFAERFFKTGPGQYGEGDRFIGVRVPAIRAVARAHQGASFSTVLALLKSKWHEERLLALLMLVDMYKRGDEADRERIYAAYLANTRFVNNWDLVDSSAPYIVGAHLRASDVTPLVTLARSAMLWERRIAILATFAFIREDVFAPTLRIARILLKDDEDLIHKAVGWMLREVGERDRGVEESFLLRHYRTMPRTMLRYAIEKFPQARRKAFLNNSA